MPLRLYVFDADDTLRRTLVPGRPCPYAPDEWALLPGVRERLATIPFGPDGPWLGVASNQDRVGYGHLTEEMARRLLRDAAWAAVDGRIEPAVELCPHVAADHCGCQKPAPGMLLRLLARFRIGPDEALFVGDAETDRLAARAAGVSFAWARGFFGWDQNVPVSVGVPQTQLHASGGTGKV